MTTVHSRTPNPAEVTRSADIVIAAVGVAQLVRGDWIKPGAVVIDVGINSVDVSHSSSLSLLMNIKMCGSAARKFLVTSCIQSSLEVLHSV